MHDIYATAYHPPNLQMLRRYNVNRGLGGLGNGAYLEEQDRQAALERKRKAAWDALTAAEREAKLAADAELKAAIDSKTRAREIMNMQAPIAKLPLSYYQEQMRRAIMAADFEAFNTYITISKFGWSANTQLGMYRFAIVNGRRIYKPFSDVDLARLFEYMAGAVNRYGYNRFAEPGSTCDWNVLLTQYVNMQIAAQKNYPNTDWRHVVEIYPGRYICQVYRPSLWVKIRAPVVIAVAIVAAIYLGPIVMAKIGEGAAAGAGGTATAAGAEATIAVTGITTTAVTTTATVAVTTAEVASAVTVATTTTGYLAAAQQVVGYVNQARTVAAIVQGEAPPPPIGISGSTFTEWALDIAKDELIKEVQERTGEYLTDRAKAKLIAAEEARLKAEIQAMQAELAKLVPPGTPIIPSKDLDADVRARIIAMQNIEREREQQMTMLLAGGAAVGALLLLG